MSFGVFFVLYFLHWSAGKAFFSFGIILLICSVVIKKKTFSENCFIKVIYYARHIFPSARRELERDNFSMYVCFYTLRKSNL